VTLLTTLEYCANAEATSLVFVLTQDPMTVVLSTNSACGAKRSARLVGAAGPPSLTTVQLLRYPSQL
jgi:hypothetical protein